MRTYRYRTALKDSARRSQWYTATGCDVREALRGEMRNITIDGDPLRVEVEGEGFWWLEASTEVVYRVRPEV